MSAARSSSVVERISAGWLIRHARVPDPAVRLFCFPFAGGAAAVFSDWPHALSDVDVLAFEPPGRGTRILETPLRRLVDLVAAAEEVVTPLLDRPFVFFGHSMGAILAFELARTLRRNGGPDPLRLMVSGASAPRFGLSGRRRGRRLHDLPDHELIVEIQRLNGTPADVCDNRELMEIMLPMLRADFEAIETYACKVDAPLLCPISAYGGREDPEVTQEELADWRDHTLGAFSMSLFPGDHFYLATARTGLLAHVSRDLETSRRPGTPGA